jgi:site-specific DNA-adenine methylase
MVRQISLFSELSEVVLPDPVNVASVPQRSPFRYPGDPGGKTWFVPTFRRFIASLAMKPRILVEPFAGGGIISLTALFEGLVEWVTLDFRHEDGLQVMAEFSQVEDAVYFIDPPYTAGGKRAGRRLYTHHLIDHEHLFTLCESLQGDFLMTYDEADEVKELARRHHFQMHLIPMKNTHHATMKELVIGRNLSWLDELPVVRESIVEYQVEGKE